MMNRRQFLATLTAATPALSGCTSLWGESSPTDTDGDGVPDEQDYAPRDSAVTEKEDLLNRTTPGVVTPSKQSIESQFLQANPGRRIHGRSVATTEDSTTAKSWLASFTDQSPNGGTLTIPTTVFDTTGQQVLLVARQFPQGKVVAYTTTSVQSSEDSATATATFDTSLPSEEKLYYTAYLIPENKTLLTVGDHELTYLCETHPFTITDGTVSVHTEPSEVPVSGQHYRRQIVEGGYVVSLSGRTLGVPWGVEYYVSRAAYQVRAQEPRGRSRRSYVDIGLQSGAADQMAAVMGAAAKAVADRADTSRLRVLIDFVQRLPYTQDDVGTGYDEYPKFIEETVVELDGDCEDTTILLAALLKTLGWDVILIEFPHHIGVGVKGDFRGSYFKYHGEKYYYVETVESGWNVGDLPESLVGVEAEGRPV